MKLRFWHKSWKHTTSCWSCDRGSVISGILIDEQGRCTRGPTESVWLFKTFTVHFQVPPQAHETSFIWQLGNCSFASKIAQTCISWRIRLGIELVLQLLSMKFKSSIPQVHDISHEKAFSVFRVDHTTPSSVRRQYDREKVVCGTLYLLDPSQLKYHLLLSTQLKLCPYERDCASEQKVAKCQVIFLSQW